VIGSRNRIIESPAGSIRTSSLAPLSSTIAALACSGIDFFKSRSLFRFNVFSWLSRLLSFSLIILCDAKPLVGLLFCQPSLVQHFTHRTVRRAPIRHFDKCGINAAFRGTSHTCEPSNRQNLTVSYLKQNVTYLNSTLLSRRYRCTYISVANTAMPMRGRERNFLGARPFT
jgi:hypothetical protein